MSLYTICFSPTGGTEKVLDILREAWGEDWTGLDLSDHGLDWAATAFQPEDVCIVAVPSFGGRVPAPAVQRLGAMNGNGARAVLVAVYGNRAQEDTLLELKDTLNAAGFHCMAAVAAVAEHSIMRQFGAQRPDARDREELSTFAGVIKAAVEHGTYASDVAVPGDRPYRAFGGVPFKPQGGRACTKCGLCAAGCPVGAIPASAPNGVDKDKCISCMRCVAVCPSHARDLNKLMLAAAAQGMKKACSERKANEIFL